jgi:hypothetical protein
MAYEVTIDVGTANERKVTMTLAEFKAYGDQRKREAIAKFDADCRASDLPNIFNMRGQS